MIDEERLRSNNKWKFAREVPNLPFKTFEQVKSALGDGSFGLELSYVAARELSSVTTSVLGRLTNIVLWSAPFFMIVILIVAAIWLGNYILLLGIPVAIVSSFMGHPMNPLRSVMSFLNFLALVGFIAAYWLGYQSIAWLLASFVVPSLANRIVYGLNLSSLRASVEKSEPLFLYLYEKNALRLRNNQTKEIYWNVER